MARSYAQIYLTIWNDPDFRDVSTDAQWLYFTMLTHPTLTSCGVMEWREPRLVAMNADMTIPRLQNAAWELGQKRLIVVDPETEEGLVRSFVRHDGILKSPNKTKALVREHAAIASLKIMEFVSVEVRRAISEDPELRGAKEADPVAKQFMEPKWNPSETVPKWFQNGSDSVPIQDTPKRGNPSKSVPPPSSLIPQPSSNDERGDAPGKPDATRATRIPDDFTITDRMREWAKKEFPEIDIDAETPHFIDHWKGVSGSKGVKLDWVATWRNWIRNSRKFAPNNSKANKQHTTKPALQQWVYY